MDGGSWTSDLRLDGSGHAIPYGLLFLSRSFFFAILNIQNWGHNFFRKLKKKKLKKVYSLIQNKEKKRERAVLKARLLIASIVEAFYSFRKLECIASYTTPRTLIASRYAALDIRPRDRNLLRHNQRNTLSPPLAGYFFHALNRLAGNLT